MAETYSPNPIPMDFSYQNKQVQKVIDAVENRTIDERQLDCLAKTLYHEARGEGRDGQIAVAMVVINRSKSGIFPKTICDVLYQKGQFQWTAYRQNITDKESWEKSRALALYVALEYNQIIDPTQGALYFHEKTVKVYWKSKKTTTIGRHVFYRTEGQPIYNAVDHQ